MSDRAAGKGRGIARRLWGRAAGLGTQNRVVSFVFVIVAIAAMSFTQLGFWPIGAVDGKPVYVMLLLGPLVMGALLFGPMMGALLGLFAGAVVYLHAAYLPLDYYEVYLMTPLNTFGLLTVLGGAAGWLFSLALRSRPKGAKRVALIIVICIVLSCAASAIAQLNTAVVYGGEAEFGTTADFLFMSPLGMLVQALLDAVLMSVLCLAADYIARMAVKENANRKLLVVFRGWMLLVSAIVFMIASAVIFSITTFQTEDEASANMSSEVEYLTNQLSRQDHASYSALLDGYKPEVDGKLFITDKDGNVLASDDPDNGTGSSILPLIGYADFVGEQGAFQGIVDEILEQDSGIAAFPAVDDNGVPTMNINVVAAGAYDGGYVIMIRPPEMIYAERFSVMVAETLLAIALIAAIAILATILLNVEVVRRIDETNDSLDKITDGNLNERVNVRDTREFTSLSTGINTTVSALKDTIAAVEQKNAQELATAKAIQESVLPTDFPAFPDIDKFDIYASMKTAKEVGGDFYDFFEIEGTAKVGFVMADVSGKGIPAALFMMTAKTQVRTYMESGLPIDEAVNAANHQLCLGNDAGMFVTMLACVLDYETGALTYVNAGHNPPLIQHEGSWEWMREVSGMPLGLFDGLPYDLIARQLEPGDMLYLYTDGVTEAMDTGGNLFGDKRLAETLAKYTDFNPRSVSVGVRRAITDFTLDCEQSDDITMLCLKYGVPPEEKAVMVLNATADQLVHVYNYIHAELHRRHAPKSVYNPLDIAAEELFVNVCHYAYPEATPDNPGEVRIGFEYKANPPSLTVQISDDGIPYNPLEKPDAVTPDSIADVPIGGLGILMAKRSVDEMTYERVGESNVLTFVKKW